MTSARVRIWVRIGLIQSRTELVESLLKLSRRRHQGADKHVAARIIEIQNLERADALEFGIQLASQADEPL